MSKTKVVWTHEAKRELKAIKNYYKPKSAQSANNIISDILSATREIHFVQQFQREETDFEHRRIIVKNYKILYRIELHHVVIVSILDTRQDPNKQHL